MRSVSEFRVLSLLLLLLELCPEPVLPSENLQLVPCAVPCSAKWVAFLARVRAGSGHRTVRQTGEELLLLDGT